MSKPKTGVLLLNLGTPDDPGKSSVRRYLKQFLSDPRVLDIPAVFRWLLLNVAILPTRPKKSAEAYSLVWTDRGSPLLFHTQDLAKALADKLDDDIPVRIAMRYQNPSMESVLEEFDRMGIEKLVVMPLYPQYASSSTGSCLEELYRISGKWWNTPSLVVVPPFYNHPSFLEASVDLAKEALDGQTFDHYLISFHGLPERHVTKSDLTVGGHCLAAKSCCDRIVDNNRYCYRAQCFYVARAMAEKLGLSESQYTVSFQSRLGRTPWIKPYTDEILEELPGKGVKSLAVMIPSFTADCLETLEEIAMQGKESFEEAGGENYLMVPSLNSHPSWVNAVHTMISEYI